MSETNKIMIVVSQIAATIVIFTFFIGMRWQQGFYGELGYSWIVGYTNYLDTIKAGISIAENLVYAMIIGYFSTSIIARHSQQLSYVVFIFGLMLIMFSELIASLATSSDQNFILVRSHIQIYVAGFLAGGLTSYICEILSKPKDVSTGRDHIFITLMLISMVMLAISDSPYALGLAAARKAISTNFLDFPFVSDEQNHGWSLIGYSQGNLILGKTEPNKNQILVKLSNELSTWTIHPSKPINSNY